MTALTPEQMRALASLTPGNRMLYATEIAGALEYAADQLEAVHQALWSGRVTISAIVRVANARQFLPRSTADTAPQEGRDD